MQINPIPLEGRIAESADIEVLIEHGDLTEAAASTAQTLTVPIASKMAVRLVRAILDVAFENTSSAGFDDLTVTVGDGGSAARFLTSTQINKNGTEVLLKSGVDIEYPYTADDTIDITFTPKTGATLLSLNAGRMRLQFKINDERAIAPAS